jgi:glutaminase
MYNQYARVTATGMLEEFLHASAARGRAAAEQGAVTTRIPALAGIPAEKFAMAVATTSGAEVHIGDSNDAFSIQSVSKLFALCALLQFDTNVWTDVGWGPTDAGYSSVADLERNHGRPRNPFVNPGALVVTDRLMLYAGDAAEATIRLIQTASLAGSVSSDPQVAASEAMADHRNSAIAHVLAEHGLLTNAIDHVLTQYFRQCAITTSVRTLARAGLFLANRRSHPACLDLPTIRRVNAVLLTSGMYDAAGDIAYRIGLPAKSGIGGGVLAIMPGLGTICVWSPPLDKDGNSTGGVAAIEEFARLAGWSVF